MKSAIKKKQFNYVHDEERLLLDGIPVYVYDITGRPVAKFKDVEAMSHTKFFYRWVGDKKNIRTITRSELLSQTAWHGKLYFTHEKNFIPNFSSMRTDHNPLRWTRTMNRPDYGMNAVRIEWAEVEATSTTQKSYSMRRTYESPLIENDLKDMQKEERSLWVRLCALESEERQLRCEYVKIQDARDAIREKMSEMHKRENFEKEDLREYRLLEEELHATDDEYSVLSDSVWNIRGELSKTKTSFRLARWELLDANQDDTVTRHTFKCSGQTETSTIYGPQLDNLNEYFIETNRELLSSDFDTPLN